MTQSDASSSRIGYTRVYSSPGGVSHFGDEAVEMKPGVYVQGIPLVDSGEAQPATALRFSHVTAGHVSDWHPAPRRHFVQFVFILAGVLEVRVGDGEARPFGPGRVVLVEDIAGQGHQTRALGTDDAVWAAVAV